ncbi:GTPase HflX [Candidatus Hepatincola sp. Av]
MLEKAIVISVVNARDSLTYNENYFLEEAVNLTKALNVEVVHSQHIKLREINPATLLNKGNLDSIKNALQALPVSLCVFNTSLTPIQQRNLEEYLKCKVIDRNGLIISIFSLRAKSKAGKLQARLAFLTYQKSRLVKAWSHLERQRGGSGFIGGPGETQKELDKRMLTEQIARLKNQLKKVKQNRILQSKARKRNKLKQIVLVGYTNAGKSTLFNTLTKENVFAKDLLFATLDPKMKAIKLQSKEVAILSDTVGFISQLPHNLIEAFKSTLDEVTSADLILHVIDAANPNFQEQITAVKEVLVELGINEENYATKVMEVYNKIDLLNHQQQATLMNLIVLEHTNQNGFSESIAKPQIIPTPKQLGALKNQALKKQEEPILRKGKLDTTKAQALQDTPVSKVLVSALKANNLVELTTNITNFFHQDLILKTLLIPYNNTELLNYITKNFIIKELNKNYQPEVILCSFLISPTDLKTLTNKYTCNFR